LQALLAKPVAPVLPQISYVKRVILVGSDRFGKVFSVWSEALMRVGKSPFALPPPHDGYARERDEHELWSAGAAHRGTIGAMDAMLVLNVAGYIGDSTRHQIKIAQELGLVVFCLEQVLAGHPRLIHDVLIERMGVPEGCSSPISTMEFLPARELLEVDGQVPIRIVNLLRDFWEEVYA
jgi:hypothetical protein